MVSKSAAKARVGGGRAAATAATSELPAELLLKMYQEMIFYRRFEERVGLAYTKRKFSGFCHLHIGQEAVAVGVQNALAENDYVLSGYRSHTQAIAKGIPAGQVMAELFAKQAGVCQGKGGSMHMFSKDKRFFGGHGIVGGQTPIAAGIGFAIRYDNHNDVCVCYLGDAATNQGAFFEAMNMVATWDLPILYIIENNQYGMGTDIHRTTSVDHLWKRALAFDMDHGDVDGMNAIEVYQKVKPIVDKMRKDHKPFLLEALTYRYRGHSVSDPGTYRTKEEVADYQKNRDPIATLGAHLQKKKLATEAELKQMDKDAKAKVDEAEAFADQAEQPPASDAFIHLLAPN